MTRSPTWTWQRRTIPEILDLTENFCRGWIWPTAIAFSTTVPFSTETILGPSLSPLVERAQAYRPPAAATRIARRNSVLKSLRMESTPSLPDTVG